ncbi:MULTISPECIES: tetratricopeptide repeat protein [Francisella]|uniref:Sel1 repeat family protein n=1 Tax=Francisella opportunistica TaxID=2016517 RepID=A0A345JPR8_9GAMM|nr:MULTISPECIES: SEL1-like repeat protein [Francisella]APC90990.1 hypothetical protein BBG19_0252 [Francisella sp. MA067296]AXH29314.1 sel1 repeat family protein [Francisella opportunistica]AXH30965.1 sel1 repeat family protein [Francisella opportunistica]AXH32612.1 sel1 repeat family protein [Francisella opportunistica]
MKAKFIIAFLSILFFSSSYATMEQCYKDGVNQDYEKVLDSCKPYLKTDARATGLLAEAYVQLDLSNKIALEYALWAVNFYQKNGAPKDPEGAMSYSYLVYLIGELYFFGSDNVNVDQKKGIKYIEKSANLGYDIAQNQLGSLYVRAGKVPGPNFAKAYKWYKLAIANGSLDARSAFLMRNERSFIENYPYCIAIGRALIGDTYLSGLAGLPKSPDFAIEWYQKAYELDHISPVETGLAKAYIAKGNNKLAYKYARQAIKQPYAPAFVVMADLTDNKIAKYAYLAEAVELYKNPALKFWSQFNEYCMPDISDGGIKQAQQKLAKIKLSQQEKELAIKEQQSLRSRWQVVTDFK